MVKGGENEDNETIIKMRGLPWSATVDSIVKFLEGTNIKNGSAGVHITMSKEGRPSGEAYIELESPDDLTAAFTKDRQHMGHRYIEIFKSTREEMEYCLEKSGFNVESVMDECCIRLRGLPFGCTNDDIIQFFSGLTIVPNGISFVSDQTGRNTGEAYVQFSSKEMVENALKKHLDKIGHRYIEIFRSSLAEIHAQTGPKIRPLMLEAVPRPSPYDRGDRFGGSNRFSAREPPSLPPRSRADFTDDEVWDTGNQWGGPSAPRKAAPPPFSGGGLKSRLSPPPAARMRNAMYGNGKGSVGVGSTWVNDSQGFLVHMRGLPFKATEQDISSFFRPLVPINIEITYDRSGRPSGEANVEFETYEDASRAMQKDKQNMSNRYIELFLESERPQEAAPVLASRNPPARSFPPFQDDGVDSGSLFSRRGGGGGSVGGGGSSVTSSAYEGFYGTATYRSAPAGGASKYSGFGNADQQRKYF